MKTLRNIGNFHIKIQAQDVDKQEIISKFQENSNVFKQRSRACSIWDLPEAVLVCILRGLHIRDLLSFRLTNSYFCNIIDNNASIWANVSFADSWPTDTTSQLFVKAAERRNLEAVVKLAVAYLYKEDPTRDDIEMASKQAAYYLCQAERLTPKIFPFFWIFIRPPWSREGSCYKLQTFQYIKDMLKKIDLPDVTFGIALIIKLQRLAVHGECKLEEEKYFLEAVKQKSSAAAFFSLMETIAVNEPDKGKELEKVRLLRQIASEDILEAKINLLRYYTQGLCGGISKDRAQEYVRDFFLSSQPSGIHVIFSGSQTSDISRYILIDWLVEVVGMKDFSAHVLYFAVSLLDRFLQVRKIQRSQVQLLGVAAIVVSSRFLGLEILTIREAAWLTDNSYTYYDVVKMMGELVATLRGDLRALTIQDYTKILLSIVNEVGYAGVLTEYISMLCLLQAEMGQYSSAEIAASCLLLSRILLNHTEAWPATLKDWTGFSQDYLSLCTFHIYNKCLLEGSEMEYRDTTLQAVKTRYADPLRYSVSSIKLIGHKELCRRLGVTKLINHGKDTKAIKFRNTDELIMSPHRSLRSDYHRSLDEARVDRDSAATPPMNNAYAFDEGCSGYEGDLEYESDESCDKSEALFEDLDISTIADTLDESKHWYSCSEDNFADESLDDSESVIQDTVDFQNGKTAVNDVTNKITCLSSMCQSGANLACHSSQLLPSSCISNCSCKKSYSSSFTLSSALSVSSLSLQCSATNSSYNLQPLSQGDFRTCLPCGSINSTSRGSRRSRLNVCSNSCDNLAHNSQVCDELPCASYYDDPTRENPFMRKAYSSQDIRTMSNLQKEAATSLSPNFICQPPHCDTSQSLSSEISATSVVIENISHQASIMDSVHYVDDVDQSFLKRSSSRHSSSRSQVLSCNNSISVYSLNESQSQGSSNLYHGPSKSSSFQELHFKQNSLSSCPSIEYSQYNPPCIDESIHKYSQTEASDIDNLCAPIRNAIPIHSISDKFSNHQLHSESISKHKVMQTPATPESMPDMAKFSNRANSFLSNHDSFTCTSFNASTSKFTTKRARLEYSASVDFAFKQLDLSFESTKCDKSNDSDMPVCVFENFGDNLLPKDFSSSKVTLKRKSSE